MGPPAGSGGNFTSNAVATLVAALTWGHHEDMDGAGWVTVGGRTWLDDADRRSRRLAVHPYPERGWTTLSVWERGECVATFHLRAADTPQLIYELASGLAVGPGTGAPPSAASSWTRTVIDVAVSTLGRGRRWLSSRATPPVGAPALRAVRDAEDTDRPSDDASG